MRTFKFLVLICLQLSLRGTDAAPTTTTTPAPTSATTTTSTTTKPPRRPTTTKPPRRQGKAFDSNQYSWEWNEMDDDYKGGDELEVEYEQPTQPPYRPTPPPYGAVPNPTVEFKYEDVGSDYPAYQEATYGPQKHCHEEDRVTYEDRRESYVEQTCRTRYVEECREVDHNNCTGSVVSKFDEVCEDVNELLCNLEENVDYDTIKEDYKVQKCRVEKETVCDTVVEIELQTRDDYQCCDVPTLRCEFDEYVVDDHICTHSFEFDCKKEKRTQPGEYGMHMMCRKVPKNSCYKTPRTVQ